MKRPIKRYCLRGHDRYEKGEPLYGKCRECDRLRKNREAEEKAKTNPRAYRHSEPIRGLREIRESAGLSTAQMATLAGVVKSTIWAIEHGEINATKLTQQKILRAVVEIKERQRDKQRRLEKAGLL